MQIKSLQCDAPTLHLMANHGDLLWESAEIKFFNKYLAHSFYSIKAGQKVHQREKDWRFQRS
jgi:hypothetical protein